VTQRFLFRAQDKNMTNGDYLFFIFSSLYSATPTEQPWVAYDFTNEDFERRVKVFYAVKQVLPVEASNTNVKYRIHF